MGVKNKMSIIGRIIFLMLPSFFSTAAAMGPGMTITFDNVIPGIDLGVRSATTAAGDQFPTPGALSPARIPLKNGKTMSGTSDNRELPEWIEFSWKEWERGRKYTNEELSGIPVHLRRVSVRDRVPRDVVDEVISSKLAAEPGKLSDRYLELFFVWYPSETRFRWAMKNRRSDVLRSGGDALPMID